MEQNNRIVLGGGLIIFLTNLVADNHSMSTSKKQRTDDCDGLHTHDVTCTLHKNVIQYLRFIPYH